MSPCSCDVSGPLTRDEVDHVLDSFAVIRKYEERDHGDFITKRRILTLYD